MRVDETKAKSTDLLERWGGERLRLVDVGEGQQIERNRTDIPERWRKTKRQLKEVAEIPYEGLDTTRRSEISTVPFYLRFSFYVGTFCLISSVPFSVRRNLSFSFEEFFIRSGSESLLSFFRRVSYVSYTGPWNERPRYIAFWRKFQEYLSAIVTIHRSFSGNKPAASFSKFVDTPFLLQ